MKKSAPNDDLDLARWVATGDPRAAAALWRKYATLVRALIRRSLGQCAEADVDDLVQDAFVGLFRSLSRLRDPGALRSFVVSTALHVARSELRRRRVRRCMSLTRTGHLPDVVHEQASDPEARRAVMRLCEVLGEVDDRGRRAFVLRHVEGCELTEVAQSLGCSLATAKRSLARARDHVTEVVKHDPLLAAYAS
jgi:RNA polymerase sigma-70 factor (ECF subfamily)